MRRLSAFAYSYVPGSDLLAGWAVGGGVSFRRTCEPARDLIAAVTNTWADRRKERGDAEPRGRPWFWLP